MEYFNAFDVYCCPIVVILCFLWLNSAFFLSVQMQASLQLSDHNWVNIILNFNKRIFDSEHFHIIYFIFPTPAPTCEAKKALVWYLFTFYKALRSQITT